ncbi:sodium-dependent multivitamin transporter-like isoform X2 [Ixodes scapularis]|uniref:sodium-dependent multivitamin transporter-like isoform X2 n=1 Tax=Ixodes scapularis TaxID=6945 RepID=UPI001A9E307E|nr:sodium-dependent multivitamin transporter-like isoform X2 [Ixodes scapularis]
MLSNGTGADMTTGSTVLDNITAGAVPTYVLPLYWLSYQWYSGFGWLVVMAVGLLVSLLTGGTDAVDRDHLSPVYLRMIGATNGKSRSWTLSRVQNFSVTSSQIPMAVVKE